MTKAPSNLTTRPLPANYEWDRREYVEAADLPVHRWRTALTRFRRKLVYYWMPR